MTNGGTPGATGIAITGIRTSDAGGQSAGTWYFSTNNGASWTAIPANVSDTAPLDLASTARVAFQPTVTNYNGQIPNALTFRAWDGFDGTANGAQASLTLPLGQNAANNAAAGAYSIAADVLPLMVDNVNNAPTATGAATLPGVLAGTSTPAGATVTSLFTPGYGDAADQQFDAAANPLGSTANPMAGIAITGNAATAGQGTWEYSVDNGAHWTAIPAGVSTTSSIVLPNSALIGFVPAAGFSGTPGNLTVHLIDSSTTQITLSLTGAQLLADTTTAYTGIDVSVNGTPSAVSSGTMALSTAVYGPVLSIVGESNATAGLGTLFDPTGKTQPTQVATTDGEIVRMRATVQLGSGVSNGTSIAIMLPTGLSYLADGSANVLLVSGNGNYTTTLTGTGLQLAEGGGAINPDALTLGANKTEPLGASLPASAISASGQNVSFNLGNLTNGGGSSQPNYVIVEFNSVVGATVPANTALISAMTATSNGGTTPVVSDYADVLAPNLVLQKTITGIVNNPDGSTTVTYKDTVTNTGNAPAYNATLDDPVVGTGTVTQISVTGTGTSVSSGPNGTHYDSTIGSLVPNGSEVFTYTVTIPGSQIPPAVANSNTPATLNWTPFNPTLEVNGKDVLVGSSVAPPVSNTTAKAGLDLVSGTVNQDLAPSSSTDNPLQPLSGQSVTVTFPSQTGTDTVKTDSSGNYMVLVPSGGPINLIVTAGGGNAPANDTLDNNPASATSLSGTGPLSAGTNPVTLSFTPAAGTNYTGVTFDFWTGLDTAPVLAGGPSATQSGAAQTPMVPFGSATITDTQLDGTYNRDFSGTTLTLQRYVGGTAAPDALDQFAGSGTAASGVFLNGSSQVLLNGSVIGTYTQSGGKLSLTFAGTGVSGDMAQTVLRGISYTFSGVSNSLVPKIVIGAQIDDANNDPISLNGAPLDPTGPHDQGPGGNLLSNVLTASFTINGPSPAAPIVGLGGTFVEPNDTNPAGVAVTVASGTDLSDIARTGQTISNISLTSAVNRAEDVLAFSNTSKITGSFSAGKLTLSAVAGQTPSLTEWQAALHAVTYFDTSDVPNNTARAVSIAVSTGSDTATETAPVLVTPVNDSPILDTAVVVALNNVNEIQAAATTPSGAVGTLVSQLVGVGTNVTDPDGAGVINGGTPGATGIAITASNNTDVGGVVVGAWYYSTNNGATWTAFPSNLSDTRPLDLTSTARVAFQPTALDFNGQVPAALTFRAWDQFDGTANGSQSNLTGVTQFGQNAANNTAATAYSIAKDVLPLMINNVNNAPTADGSTSALPSDSTSTGQTVAALFGKGFSDGLDQQFDASGNPTGSLHNGLAGVAIVGDAAPSTQGVWRYSLDNGKSWSTIPTTVSDHSAIVIPSTAVIAFSPAAGFSGVTGNLTVRLIDSSTVPVLTGLTGAQLGAQGSNGVTPHDYVNVDVSNNGGSSAVSSQTMALNTDVPIVIQPPVPPPPAPTPPQPPANPGIYHTADLMERPLIPDLSLIGSVANRFIIVEQQAVISVPPNIFQSNLPNPELQYEARLPDGSPLPNWLSFDPGALTFTGTPPLSAQGRLEILIRARDIAGNTADATFNILIGHQTSDLVKLLEGGPHRPTSLRNLLQRVDSAPQHLREAITMMAANEPAVSPERMVIEQVNVPAPHADLPAIGANGGGFTQALHTAGQMGTLARARSFLDDLDSLVRARPAA